MRDLIRRGLKPSVLMLLMAAACCVEATISKPWSRATINGAEAGAVFAVITGGDTDDKLIAAESTASNFTEVHEHAIGADGVMAMREVQGGIPIPAKGVVELKPRSYHIMLIGLKAPLTKGAQVPVTFVFDRAGKVAVIAEIVDPWAMTADDR
jgi:copper(I)-binding protein